MAKATMTLTQLIDRARDYKMSPSDRRAQRVSMIMGLRSNESTLTKEKVEELLDNIEGRDPQETRRN